VLALRMEADVVARLDEARERLGLKTRMDLFRKSLADYLAAAGEHEVAQALRRPGLMSIEQRQGLPNWQIPAVPGAGRRADSGRGAVAGLCGRIEGGSRTAHEPAQEKPKEGATLERRCECATWSVRAFRCLGAEPELELLGHG
jgi:hypothetical protein